MKIIINSIFILIFALAELKAQYIPVHQNENGVYSLLDQLAAARHIELNQSVKPFSRSFIAKQLTASLKSKNLAPHLKNEIVFYLNEYRLESDLPTDSNQYFYKKNNTEVHYLSPSIQYNDALFKMKMYPILGMQIYSNENGNFTQRWYGAGIQGSIGKHFSFYSNLHDVTQDKFSFKKDTLFSHPGYLTNTLRGAYKGNGDYSEMRGGVFANWKWGHFGLVKDHVLFGNSYHCNNIISANTPSFPMIKLQIKPVDWFELNYFHAWLVSNVIDSSNFYTDNTGAKKFRYHNKYIAGNMISFRPFKNFYLNLGNSIVYAEKNIKAAYLLPLMFYKSMDHSSTMGVENQNSQLFFTISSRNIKNLHLYSSIFIDELSFYRFLPKDKETNPISYQTGIGIYNLLYGRLQIGMEYTRNQIITYKHSIPVLDYNSNGYRMGHYLGDNSEEIYSYARIKIYKGINLHIDYIWARKGNDYSYNRHDKNFGILDIISEPMFKDVIWKHEGINARLTYEIFNQVTAVAEYSVNQYRTFNVEGTLSSAEILDNSQQVEKVFVPPFYIGNTHTFRLGLWFGLGIR